MNTAAKFGGLGTIIGLMLGYVPVQYDLYVALFIIICGAITAEIPPPHAGGKLAVVWQILNAIALNIGWAENHFKPGQSGVRVPLVDKPAAKQAVASAGIPVLNKKGHPETPVS